MFSKDTSSASLHNSDDSSDEDNKKEVINFSKYVKNVGMPSTSKASEANIAIMKPKDKDQIMYSKPLSKNEIKAFKEHYDSYNFVTGTCSVAWNVDTEEKTK